MVVTTPTAAVGAEPRRGTTFEHQAWGRSGRETVIVGFMQISPGRPYPLGATFDGSGTNFAIYSSVAERVELCLLDDAGNEQRIDLTEVDAYVWHGYFPSIRPGQRYGYRVHGPFDPAAGHRCDPSKLLLDPYAKAIDGQVSNDPSLFSYSFEDPEERNEEDSAAHTMVSVVINPYFDWGHDRPPGHEYHNSVIYEAHVKGMTKLHPDVPEELRGTYAGMSHPAIIEHLRTLGITAVELMPIHQFVQDLHLQEKGLRNYWGYNSIGFFAPHNEYAAYGTRGEQVDEFKTLVKALHEANIEVILDVVYNHTAEGNHLGPTLSFRGIDNASYYRLVEGDEAHYFDTTGTGNSLLMRSPHTLQMIMDSLRYWVEEMHVDGFRFDLASTLARELHEVDRLSSFFDIIQQDPIISQVKLIAEPWDVGPGGYQVGGFPPLWTEWNGQYRDTVRDFWRGEPSTLSEFASRITGSADLYEHTGRRPVASINFVTAHDGFTLRDLVSYNEKHNEANGEGGADGESHNRSWNCGVEGPTDDPEINALRLRQQRNFLATLFVSQGVPMLLHGDEFGRTQDGNNNTYCQDNELTWVDWDLDEEQRGLLDFTRRMIALHHAHPVLRRRRFFAGDAAKGGESDIGDIEWFTPGAHHMADEDWGAWFAKSMMVFLNGDAIPESDARGNRTTDDSLLILLNADANGIDFTLPPESYGVVWRTVLDTYDLSYIGRLHEAGETMRVAGRSVTVLLNPRDEDPDTARADLEIQVARDLQIAAQKETVAAAAAGSADAAQAAKLLALATSAQPAPRRVVDGEMAGSTTPVTLDQVAPLPEDTHEPAEATQSGQSTEQGAEANPVEAAQRALDRAKAAARASEVANGKAAARKKARPTDTEPGADD